MRKALTILVLVLLTAVLSLTAQTMTVRIQAFAPERISFEQTDDSFSVKTNMSNVEYGFYSNDGSLVNPESATVLAISAL